MPKPCIHCGNQVGGGGDRHARIACPPRALGSDSQRARRKRAAKRRAKRNADLIPARGQAVAGTGVPKGE
jgi:hypothetical protein